MNNTTITLATTREENKNELLNAVANSLTVLEVTIPSIAKIYAETRPDFSKRFTHSYNVLKEEIDNFAKVLKGNTADMEEMKELSWNVMTACVPVQECFCDAEYFGHRNDIAHLLAKGIEELFTIAHEDANHLLRNGATPLFRVLDENHGKLLVTSNRDEFAAKCQELGIENYEVALNNYEENGGEPAFLNIPTAIYRKTPVGA